MCVFYLSVCVLVRARNGCTSYENSDLSLSFLPWWRFSSLFLLSFDSTSTTHTHTCAHTYVHQQIFMLLQISVVISAGQLCFLVIEQNRKTNLIGDNFTTYQWMQMKLQMKHLYLSVHWYIFLTSARSTVGHNEKFSTFFWHSVSILPSLHRWGWVGGTWEYCISYIFISFRNKIKKTKKFKIQSKSFCVETAFMHSSTVIVLCCFNLKYSSGLW